MYRTGRKLGTGAFGDVYEATHVTTGKTIAMKVEPADPTRGASALQNEATYLGLLAGRRDGRDGVPSVTYDLEEVGGNLVLGIDLLGPDLARVLVCCGGVLPPQDALKIATQLLEAMEFIHGKGILHCDLKPDNVVLGLGRRSDRIVAIDFGLARLWVGTKGHVREPVGLGGLVGTPRFASVNAHEGVLSRRDDVISLGYTLIYLLKGRLPWQGINQGPITRQGKYRVIAKMKKNMTPEDLCDSEDGHLYPTALEAYLEDFFDHAEELGFADAPNYSYLRRLLTAGAAAARLDISSPGFSFDAAVRAAPAGVGVATTYSNVPQGLGGESWESSTVTSALNELSAQSEGGRVPLEKLNARLEKLHLETGITMREMKEVIKEKGFCLRNCQAYHEQLKATLRNNPKLLLPKGQAKQYKYVKQCLVML